MHVEEVVRPFRISKVSFKASSVLQKPLPHTIYRTGTKIGDRFEISSSRAPAPRPAEFRRIGIALTAQRILPRHQLARNPARA